MGVGFGAEAIRFAARLPPGLPMIAAGFDGCVAGLEAAVERRRAGTPFYAAPLVDDPRALIAQRLAGNWIQTLTDIDDRYAAFDALAADRLADAGIEISADELAVIDDPERRVLRDFAIMGDALLVRSTREAERVARVLKRHRPAVIVAPGEDPAVPFLTAINGDAIVVWAPYAAADRLGVIAMALEYMHSRVIYVCASGQLAFVRGTFVDPTHADAALTAASCIVDASIGDPAGAIALRRIGVPIVAASTAGVSEFMDGALEYDPWDWRTIFAAVAAARGAHPPVLKHRPATLQELTSTLERVATPAALTEPLVSVVVLTYNRRELLRCALDSIARQHYRKIELIVVNNGGIDIADIVADYGPAHVMNLTDNILPNAALDLGFEACQGKYFCVLSDDDEYFPDHLARLVDALETSNAEVGHSNTLTRYLSLANGRRETVAYRVRSDRPADKLQILVGGTMAFHSMLFRRDVRALLGGLQIDVAPADYEYTLRAAQRFDFVHVDSVTCEWNYAIEGTSYTHRDNMYDGLKCIYEEYPSNGSRIVEQRRLAELERFSERNSGKALWPPDLLLARSRPNA